MVGGTNGEVRSYPCKPAFNINLNDIYNGVME